MKYNLKNFPPCLLIQGLKDYEAMFSSKICPLIFAENDQPKDGCKLKLKREPHGTRLLLLLV